jgi:predicted PurR-regulated permease PerM
MVDEPHAVGRPLDRQSPFMIGLTGTAGAAVTVGLVQLVVASATALVLLGLALFLAIGLEPAVTAMTRRGIPRGLAVAGVGLLLLAMVTGFVASAIVPLATQAAALLDHAPQLLVQLQRHSEPFSRLSDRLQVQQHLEQWLSGGASVLLGRMLGAGAVVPWPTRLSS